MGLFIANDGRYRGWLAVLLCCCFALADDESPAERGQDKSEGKAVKRCLVVHLLTC